MLSQSWCDAASSHQPSTARGRISSQGWPGSTPTITRRLQYKNPRRLAAALLRSPRVTAALRSQSPEQFIAEPFLTVSMRSRPEGSS